MLSGPRNAHRRPNYSQPLLWMICLMPPFLEACNPMTVALGGFKYTSIWKLRVCKQLA